jgi:hypothetical protein
MIGDRGQPQAPRTSGNQKLETSAEGGFDWWKGVQEILFQATPFPRSLHPRTLGLDNCSAVIALSKFDSVFSDHTIVLAIGETGIRLFDSLGTPSQIH